MYTICIVFLTALSFAMAISIDGIIWVEYGTRMAIIALALVGLFGFSWEKSLARPLFWKCVFWLMLALLAFVVWRDSNSENLQQICGGLWCSTVRYLIGIAFMAPLFIGLFRYAYRNSELWNSKTSNR